MSDIASIRDHLTQLEHMHRVINNMMSTMMRQIRRLENDRQMSSPNRSRGVVRRNTTIASPVQSQDTIASGEDDNDDDEVVIVREVLAGHSSSSSSDPVPVHQNSPGMQAMIDFLNESSDSESEAPAPRRIPRARPPKVASRALREPEYNAPMADTCAICYETYIKGNSVTTECNHNFCQHCMNRMLHNVERTGLKCPLCNGLCTKVYTYRLRKRPAAAVAGGGDVPDFMDDEQPSRRRRVRQRIAPLSSNNAIDIVPHANQAADIVPLSNEVVDIVHHANQAADIVPPTNEAVDIVPPANEEADIVPPVDEVADIVPPANEEADIVPPVDKVVDIVPPANEEADIVPPANETADIIIEPSKEETAVDSDIEAIVPAPASELESATEMSNNSNEYLITDFVFNSEAADAFLRAWEEAGDECLFD